MFPPRWAEHCPRDSPEYRPDLGTRKAHMKKHILWTAAIGSTLFLGGSLRAAGEAATKDLDKLFIKSTAIGNMCEMKLSQAAQSQAQNEQVKQFAQKMLQ